MGKGILEMVENLGLGYYGCSFLVQKATRWWKMVIDLLALSHYITPSFFKIDMVTSVLWLASKEDVMFSVDLKNAHFQIPIWPYLRIALLGRAFQFKAFSFGLSTALQVFIRMFFLVTKVFCLVSERAQWQGICLWYFDDLLIFSDTLPWLLEHQELLLSLCKTLGIVASWEKSDFKLTSRA